MTKFSFLYILILFTLIGCTHDATKDKDNVAIIIDETEALVSKYDNNVQSALDNKKYDYIRTVSDSTLLHIDSRIESLINIPLSPSNEKLRTTALEYAKSLQQIVETEQLYTTLSDTTSMDRANYLDQNFKKVLLRAKKIRNTYISELEIK